MGSSLPRTAALPLPPRLLEEAQRLVDGLRLLEHDADAVCLEHALRAWATGGEAVRRGRGRVVTRLRSAAQGPRQAGRPALLPVSPVPSPARSTTLPPTIHSLSSLLPARSTTFPPIIHSLSLTREVDEVQLGDDCHRRLVCKGAAAATTATSSAAAAQGVCVSR